MQQADQNLILSKRNLYQINELCYKLQLDDWCLFKLLISGLLLGAEPTVHLTEMSQFLSEPCHHFLCLQDITTGHWQPYIQVQYLYHVFGSTVNSNMYLKNAASLINNLKAQAYQYPECLEGHLRVRCYTDSEVSDARI